MMKKKVIIIGGGIGGLATAAFLGKEGYDVTILEKNEQVGGRASVWKSKGFTFDMGPSWYLMPEVFEKFFSYFGKTSKDFFTLKKLDPQYRVFWGPKDYSDIRADKQKTLSLFESFEKGARENISRYLEQAKENYDISMKHILYKNFTKITDFLTPEMAIVGRKMQLFRSLNSFVSTFTKSEKIKKILQYNIVFLGGSPKNTPAFYSLMAHVDFNLGVFYPQKGIRSVVEALITLCNTQKVRIKTNCDVEKIIVTNGIATGVKAQGKIYTADIIVSNGDYHYTETHLLEKKYQTFSQPYWEKKTLAPSTFLLYLGIKGKIKALSHHNLFFAHDWEKHFDQIFKNPTWPDKPSYYLCCPSKTDPSVAPKDCENLFYLTPVPAGLADSEKVIKKYEEKVIKELEELIGESLTGRILVKRVFTQKDFTSRYHAYKGTALGLAHTLSQTAIFRPGNNSKKVANLYYVGQYTQPGIGMPICIISAELTARRIIREQN